MNANTNDITLSLYPLKFRTLHKEKIWGGNRLKQLYHISDNEGRVGESWLLSGLDGEQTLVANGFLADNSIDELVEVYMGELVGDKVYEQFGDKFPLLFKLIDAADDLSIQVHPDDNYASEHGLESGKTEMWYVLQSDNSEIIYGLNSPATAQQVREALDDHTLLPMLHREKVKEGDCVLISSGTIHSLGKGIMVAEIQQSCDITYRLYDYGRRDSNGQTRELHVDQALEVASLEPVNSALIDYDTKQNGAANICQTPYFTVNTLLFDRPVARDYATLDSFVVYLCINGQATLSTSTGVTQISEGELVLLPASENDVLFTPLSAQCRLLEVYID